MVREREAGRTRALGVSNVSRCHLEQMVDYHGEAPAFVQNRCFARMGWDRDVRAFCREHQITYQGFSLLTANPEVVGHPLLRDTATKLGATPAQIVFRFSQLVGMLPLTGTTDPTHMAEDLVSRELNLPDEFVRTLETL